MKYDIRRSLGLYLITGPCGDLEDSVREAVKCGVTMVQLREKGLDRCELVDMGLRIKKITDEAGIPLIINDDYIAAAKIGAAGVHLGLDDGDIASVRKEVGSDMIIGASANNPEEALLAAHRGADYIGAGALHPTSTKKNTRSLSLEGFSDICRLSPVPVIGIGGITLDDIEDIMQAGGAGIAVSSLILGSGDICRTASMALSMVRRTDVKRQGTDV